MSGMWKAASVGQVWLTAVMTLMAGFPQVECLCPRETAKTRASATAASAPRCCCCGGAKCCCSSTGSGGCCRVRAGTPAKPSSKHAVVSRNVQTQVVQAALVRPECVKGLADSQAFASSPGKSNAGTDKAPGAYLTASLGGVAALPSPICRMPAGSGPPPSLPPDLITLHQHFII